jgi:hypothetical protein
MPNEQPSPRQWPTRRRNIDVSGLLTCVVALAFLVLMFFGSCGVR